MSVNDVCKLLSKLDGINKKYLQNYQDSVIENNISGRILVSCELSEVKQVLEMKFGDWQLFESAIKSLIERENNFSARKSDPPNQEESGISSQNSLNSYGSNKIATSINSNVPNNKYEKGSEPSIHSNGESSGSVKYSIPQMDNTDDFQTIKEHEELVLLNKRSRMTRNDSIVQQMSYESGLLNNAMYSFCEMDEEDEEEESETFEVEADITPAESMTSFVENKPERSHKKILPVQFSLSCEHDNEVLIDPHRDTEPLLGATAIQLTDLTTKRDKRLKQNHHLSLEEISQIIAKDVGNLSNSLSNSTEKLNAPLAAVKKEDTGKSTDSSGFTVESARNVDSVQIVNELKHDSNPTNSFEESIQEYMIGSTQRSGQRLGQRSPLSADSSDNIQMINIDHRQDKKSESFV